MPGQTARIKSSAVTVSPASRISGDGCCYPIGCACAGAVEWGVRGAGGQFGRGLMASGRAIPGRGLRIRPFAMHATNVVFQSTIEKLHRSISSFFGSASGSRAGSISGAGAPNTVIRTGCRVSCIARPSFSVQLMSVPWLTNWLPARVGRIRYSNGCPSREIKFICQASWRPSALKSAGGLALSGMYSMPSARVSVMVVPYPPKTVTFCKIRSATKPILLSFSKGKK